MNLGKKFLNKVKPIFGKKSSGTERPLENNISSDGLTTQPLGPLVVGAHTSRPDPLREGNRNYIQATKAGSAVVRNGNNNAAATTSHSGRERTTINTETTVPDDMPGVLDIKRRNLDRQYPGINYRDVDTIEKGPRIWGANPSISNNHDHRAAAGSNKDRDSAFPLGRPPVNHSLYGSMSFDGVTNSGISIGGGAVNVNNTFNNNASERIRPGLELLQKRVATSAFHNSAQRIDPPRCHPDTRVTIQQQIYDWILIDLLVRQAWIMWMHGAAGAGKSAIVQSVAELCEKAKIPLASFFFFRTDPTRNSMAPFIATIVYQLIQKIPQARDEIFMIIENNPLIFGESLESQLDKLLVQPLLRLQDHFKHFFVVFIDGLDECIERAHQSDLIKLLGTISHSRTTPVVFLVSSRREAQIEAAFIRKQVSDLVLTLPLDDSDIEQTSDDIRRFLTDKFRDITETHLRRHLLPTDWPPVSDVEEIVAKSSGQFIYASVVISYISSPRNNPAHLLEIVHGIRLRDPSSINPFAHLDALYQHIFSQVEALDQVLNILASILILKISGSKTIEMLFLLERGGLEVCFADLTAVIKIDRTRSQVTFLHASLPDFLRDKTRSERYHIDIEEYTQKLLCMLLDRDPLLQDSRHWSQIEYYRLDAILTLLTIGVTASDRFRWSFMNFRIKLGDSFSSVGLRKIVWILEKLKNLNFNDQGQAYYHVRNVFAEELVEFWSWIDSSFIMKPIIVGTDLWPILVKLAKNY